MMSSAIYVLPHRLHDQTVESLPHTWLCELAACCSSRFWASLESNETKCVWMPQGEPIGITVLRDNSVPKGIVLKGVEGLSTIVQEDIVACDSIVHVVDGVLLPAAAIAEIGSKSSKGTSIVRSG